MAMSDIHQKPLKQEVQYDMGSHLIYGKQKTWKKVIEWILTCLGWIVMLTYIGYLLYGTLAIRYGWDMYEFFFFTKEMVLAIQEYFFIYLIAFLIFIVLMIVWKNYNYQKYGKLHRRTFQPAVSNEELCEMFKLDASVIEQMQNERYVVLEKNIIPEDLGMGKEKETKEKSHCKN